MSGSGREGTPNARELSRGIPGSPGVVGRPTQMSGSGQKVLLDVQVWLRVPSGCPEEVERPS